MFLGLKCMAKDPDRIPEVQRSTKIRIALSSKYFFFSLKTKCGPERNSDEESVDGLSCWNQLMD